MRRMFGFFIFLGQYRQYTMLVVLEIDCLFNFNGFFKHIFGKVSTDLETSYVCLHKNAER